MNTATAAVTMMAITLVRLPLDGLVALAALGFEGATRGRFLARSIFLCRLVGTRGNLLSTFFSGKVFIQYSPAKAQRRKENAEARTSSLRLCAFARENSILPAMPLVAVIPEPNTPVEVREVAEPDLEPNSALLEVEVSEVCGTDVYLQQGRLAGVPYPLIPGHVSVGRLQKIRGELFDVEGKRFNEGDRITFLDVHRTCNACWYCLVAKAGTRCPQRKVYGITYGLDDGLCGGWATHIYLKPGTRCIRLDATPETFMAGGCALPTSLHAVERGDVKIGDTVLVLGSGPVGINAIMLALMRGALRVLCIGAPQARLEAALAAGADAALNIETHDETQRLEWVWEQTAGRGADVTIEATGVPDAVVQAMTFTRDAGTVVVVGQYTDHGLTTFNPHLDLNKKHLDVRGCWGSEFSHFYRATQLAAKRSEPWTRMTLISYGLERANEALADVSAGRVLKALIRP
jgi:threonine dehydrogenase-like Zn-dependent dehydrogenase